MKPAEEELPEPNRTFLKFAYAQYNQGLDIRERREEIARQLSEESLPPTLRATLEAFDQFLKGSVEEIHKGVEEALEVLRTATTRPPLTGATPQAPTRDR